VERPLYFDVEGNEHARKDWDYHHVFARGDMKGCGEKQWADLFQVPMFKVWHNLGKGALHSNVQHCPKPNRDLMYLLRQQRMQQIEADKICVAQNVPPASRYDHFLDMNEYIHQISEKTPHIGLKRLTERIAENLELQTPYILQGMVEVRMVEE
jgi:hypothetical protein